MLMRAYKRDNCLISRTDEQVDFFACMPHQPLAAVSESDSDSFRDTRDHVSTAHERSECGL
jgi:hypothetical protein